MTRFYFLFKLFLILWASCSLLSSGPATAGSVTPDETLHNSRKSGLSKTKIEQGQDNQAEMLTVKGYLWRDTNGNAIKEETEEFVTGEEWYVFLKDEYGDVSFEGLKVDSATGAFTFTKVRPGLSHTVLFSRVNDPGGDDGVLRNYAYTGYNFDGVPATQIWQDGVAYFKAGTSGTSTLGLGVNPKPRTAQGTVQTVANPGGSEIYHIPSRFFTNEPGSATGVSDTPPGYIAGIKLSYPSGTNRFFVNGVLFTDQWVFEGAYPEGIIPANSDGAPLVDIGVDPVDGNSTVRIVMQAVDNGGGLGERAGIGINFSTGVTLSGNIYNDGNGLVDGLVNKSGTGSIAVSGEDVDPLAEGAQPLFVSLVSRISFLGTVPVNADGSFSYPFVNNGSYYLILGSRAANDTYPTGVPVPGWAPAPGWAFVGEASGVDGIPDANADGVLEIAVEGVPLTNLKFGINRKPVVFDQTAGLSPNPARDDFYSIPAEVFSGTDIEDNLAKSSLAGKKLRFSSLKNGRFLYDGAALSDQIVENFNPELLKVDPNASGATTDLTHPKLSYSLFDVAGSEAVSKTITLPFSESLTVSGMVVNDGNGVTPPTSTIDGTGTHILSGVPLHANLFAMDNTLLATTPVDGSGSYSFPVTPSVSYQISVGTTPAYASSTPASTTTLPPGWTYIGENMGTGPGSDGDANGILPVTVSSGNLTNANFGLNLAPETDNKTAMIVSQPEQNDIIPLDGSVFLAPEPSGSDAETYNPGGSLNGKSIAITALPTHGELWYDQKKIEFGVNGSGVPSLSNPFIISNLTPSMLAIKLSGGGYTTTKFSYASVDAAGTIDPSPATYELYFNESFPVTIASFSVHKKENTSLLKWETTWELNSSYFAVEHSATGSSWSEIGQIQAKGSSNSLIEYSFVHAEPMPGQNLYRLKAVDADGTYAYSSIRSLTVPESETIVVFPNPVADKLYVSSKIRPQEIAQLAILTSDGKQVFSNQGVIASPVSVNHLNQGIYTLIIRLRNGKIFARRFAVSR